MKVKQSYITRTIGHRVLFIKMQEDFIESSAF